MLLETNCLRVRVWDQLLFQCLFKCKVSKPDHISQCIKQFTVCLRKPSDPIVTKSTNPVFNSFEVFDVIFNSVSTITISFPAYSAVKINKILNKRLTLGSQFSECAHFLLFVESIKPPEKISFEELKMNWVPCLTYPHKRYFLSEITPVAPVHKGNSKLRKFSLGSKNKSKYERYVYHSFPVLMAYFRV